MKDIDAQLMMEALTEAQWGANWDGEDGREPRGPEAFDTSTPQGVAYWIIDTVTAYEDGGMDDETREQFHNEVDEIMTTRGIDPVQTIAVLDASKYQVPRPHALDELNLIDRYIELNVSQERQRRYPTKPAVRPVPLRSTLR